MRNAGFKTYGQWTDKELLEKANVFSLVLADESKITTEIIQATALRYAKGEVTTWTKDGDKPVDNDFPTAAQFLNACVQTWHLLYRLVADGERIEDGARILTTRVERRAAAVSEAPVLEPRATPEQVAALRSHLGLGVQSLPDQPGRSRRIPNPEADAVLAQMTQIRKQHEGTA